MTWAPAVISVAGTLAAGVSQYNQAKKQAAYAKANARLAEQQGESEAALIREKARRLSGENRAAIGASGVDISGSFLDALADSDIDAELDAQTALWSSKIEETNHRTYAKALASRGKRDLMSGVFGAGTELLNELTK
jgi:hypothetical protein